VKKTLALAVAVIFVLAFAAPVFAQSITWDTVYEMDGNIDIEKQVGHLCNTGAEFKQTIKGEGEMSKVIDTAQVAGKLTVSDSQDWVTAADAVRNLTVTSVIELCAPAKSEFADFDDIDLDALAEWVNDPDFGEDFYENHEGQVIPVHWLYWYDQFNDPYDAVNPLTDQIWAVQVSADPGFSGGLTQDFEAAYGPWRSHHSGLNDADDSWWFVDDDGEVFAPNGAYWAGGFDDVKVGDDYVGNYFNIDQMARTSQGTTKRYISISSPWSHAYLMEDMEVVGMTEITESFSMDNIAPGAEAVPNWWALF